MRKKMIIAVLAGVIGIACVTGLCIKNNLADAKSTQSEQGIDEQDTQLDSEDCSDEDKEALSKLLESEDTREIGMPSDTYK